jgi:NADH:ubiquinone oxidoreductase subunit 5 (subunit L)/multisubunit Na+/H+ antiporter MnhA subunit
MTLETATHLAGLGVLFPPFLLLAGIGFPVLLNRPLSETTINRANLVMTLLGLASALTMLGLMLATGARFVPVELGHWVYLHEAQFHFHVKLVFDRLSIPFVILCYLLCGTVSAFTSRYLHREPGFVRFNICTSLFLLGIVATALAGTIEVLFAGWELVGLSSALLVAFFHERRAPVENGLRIWTIYRLADAAFLVAAVALHHLFGAGDFEGLMGHGSWPAGEAALTSQQALWVGLLLVVAAAGKSALVPFSGWLPRAMEGPTPSSAIFYGALSVHLGAYLLLRVSPLLDASPLLGWIVVGLGAITAMYAALAARVQTDIKSALAYASLTQVGIIVVEIGLGLRYLALIHIIGHASLRTLQLLRAPTLLRDYQAFENAIGGRVLPEGGWWNRLLPRAFQIWLYRFAMERGYFDTLLDTYVVAPFRGVLRGLERVERRWTSFLAGGSDELTEPLHAQREIIEDLRL